MGLLRRLLSRRAPLCNRNSGVSIALGRGPPGTAPLARCSPLGGRIDHSGAPVRALDAG